MRWVMTLLVAVGALGAAAVAGAEQRYSDPAGDSASSLDISEVVVTNDTEQVVIRVGLPGTLPEDNDVFLVEIDSDGSSATGKDGFEVRVFGMSLRAFVEVWNGTDWVDAPPAGISVRVELSGGTSARRITLPRSLLSNTSGFNFLVSTAKFSGDDIVGSDRAPDGGGTWRYDLALKQCSNGRDDDGDGKVDSNDLGCTGTDDDLESDDPYTLAIGRPTVTPATGKGGNPVVVKARVTQAETDQPIRAGTVRCTTKAGATTKRSVGQLASGTATCRLMAPRVVKPTTIRGTMTVTSKAATASVPFSFRSR